MSNLYTLKLISLKFGSIVGPCLPFCLLKFQIDRFIYDRVTADRARPTQNRRSSKPSVIKIWCCAGKLALVAQPLTDRAEILNRSTLICYKRVLKVLDPYLLPCSDHSRNGLRFKNFSRLPSIRAAYTASAVVGTG